MRIAKMHLNRLPTAWKQGISASAATCCGRHATSCAFALSASATISDPASFKTANWRLWLQAQANRRSLGGVMRLWSRKACRWRVFFHAQLCQARDYSADGGSRFAARRAAGPAQPALAVGAGRVIADAAAGHFRLAAKVVEHHPQLSGGGPHPLDFLPAAAVSARPSEKRARRRTLFYH